MEGGLALPQVRGALDRLALYVEQDHDAIASVATDAERALLTHLRDIGALRRADTALPLICPSCEIQIARLVDEGTASCPSCGLVDSVADDRLRWEPDLEWLVRRIAQALGLFDARPRPVVEDHVWRIGDIGRGAGRRRILFGRRIDTLEMHSALDSGWRSHVGDTAALMITTTPLDRLRLLIGLLPVQVVPLLLAFQLLGGGLLADGPVWKGLVRPSLRADPGRHGPFSRDFRLVWLPDKGEPVRLTPLQAAVFRVLWNLDGVWIRGDELMQQCGSEEDKPVAAFRRSRHPEAHRIYKRLVRQWQGWYRLPRDEPYG